MLTESLKIHVVINQTACYVQYKFIELLFLDGFLAITVTQIIYRSGNSLVGRKGKKQSSFFSLSISVTPLYKLGLYVAAIGCVKEFFHVDLFYNLLWFTWSALVVLLKPTYFINNCICDIIFQFLRIFLLLSGKGIVKQIKKHCCKPWK